MSTPRIADREFDYIIVGGGSAGCVLASRLSENPTLRVLLIEAGPDTPPGAEPDEILQTAPVGAALAAGDRFIWPELEVGVVRESEEHLPQRAFYEQGRVLGGGSSVNVMAANRGLPRDYDQWDIEGATGWNWEGILPFFKELERDLDYAGPLHSNSGPIPIRRERATSWPPFVRNTVAGLQALGLQDIGDQNGVFTDGYFRPAQSNENGLRGSTARGYLNETVRRRQNLVLLTEAFVEHVLIEDRRATGVSFNWQQQTLQATARHDVILAAGALRTPGLLLRAGIGPAADLQQLGIPVIADRPGVGENLLDHPANFLSVTIPPEAGISPDGDSHHGLAVRLSSGVDPEVTSDLYLVVGVGVAGPGTASFGLWVNKPSSKGRLKLRDSDPHSQLDINFDLLSDPRDLERFRAGFGFIGKLVQQVGLAAYDLTVGGTAARVSFARPATNPPPPIPLATLLGQEGALLSYLRQSVKGLWHASGTARIGRADDPYAVTDHAGRVYGVEGLRVADTSLFPSIPRANTNLPAIAAAEKIAALIAAQSGIDATRTEQVFS